MLLPKDISGKISTYYAHRLCYGARYWRTFFHFGAEKHQGCDIAEII